MEQGKEQGRGENGKALAVRPQRPQNVAPEDQFLSHRRHNGCVKEHGEGIGSAGHRFQGGQNGAAEAIHHQFQNRHPNRIHQLGADAQTQQYQCIPELQRLDPGENLPLPVVLSLPGMEDGQHRQNGNDVTPAVIHGRSPIHLG